MESLQNSVPRDVEVHTLCKMHQGPGMLVSFLCIEGCEIKHFAENIDIPFEHACWGTAKRCAFCSGWKRMRR